MIWRRRSRCNSSLSGSPPRPPAVGPPRRPGLTGPVVPHQGVSPCPFARSRRPTARLAAVSSTKLSCVLRSVWHGSAATGSPLALPAAQRIRRYALKGYGRRPRLTIPHPTSRWNVSSNQEPGAESIISVADDGARRRAGHGDVAACTNLLIVAVSSTAPASTILPRCGTRWRGGELHGAAHGPAHRTRRRPHPRRVHRPHLPPERRPLGSARCVLPGPRSRLPPARHHHPGLSREAFTEVVHEAAAAIGREAVSAALSEMFRLICG